MRNLKLILVALTGLTLFFTSCKKQEQNAQSSTTTTAAGTPVETETTRSNKVPSSFKVNIPSSISEARGSRSESDTLYGEDIYDHLTTFIHVGEGAADVVQDIMSGIAYHNIDRAMTVTFDGEDGREKYLEVVENVTHLGKKYELMATISDRALMGNADGGKGMQVFWNTSPVEGIAILKPYHLNINDDEEKNAVFSVEYSEKGDLGYDAHMIVQIADLEMPSPLEDPYALNNLKMFVGKKGDNIDVYGNSNHPNASFFTDERGFNWAFAASGSESKDIAVAEVGLPSSKVDSDSRSVILKDNSMKSIITAQIYEAWPTIDDADVQSYTAELGAPGFFDESGFIAAETKPSNEYDVALDRIEGLTPYSPKAVSELEILFK